MCNTLKNHIINLFSRAIVRVWKSFYKDSSGHVGKTKKQMIIRTKHTVSLLYPKNLYFPIVPLKNKLNNLNCREIFKYLNQII
jgi:hypothetical protein